MMGRWNLLPVSACRSLFIGSLVVATLFGCWCTAVSIYTRGSRISWSGDEEAIFESKVNPRIAGTFAGSRQMKSPKSTLFTFSD